LKAKASDIEEEYLCFHEWATNFCVYACDLLMAKSIHDKMGEVQVLIANDKAEIKSSSELI